MNLEDRRATRLVVGSLCRLCSSRFLAKASRAFAVLAFAASSFWLPAVPVVLLALAPAVAVVAASLAAVVLGWKLMSHVTLFKVLKIRGPWVVAKLNCCGFFGGLTRGACRASVAS